MKFDLQIYSTNSSLADARHYWSPTGANPWITPTRVGGREGFTIGRGSSCSTYLATKTGTVEIRRNALTPTPTDSCWDIQHLADAIEPTIGADN
ncbi:hypothetical protein [Nocardia sp. NPDC020380]|uniref:hypothetical protein n=1 Tax=Nocardia sp. NPDC020380 TaxID=3364309 RepID=UPI00378890AF